MSPSLRTHVPGGRREAGFTLVELAIAIIIAGLLLAGILASTELLVSSRAKALIGQIEGSKAAYFGFQDRYRARPGDFARAVRDIPGCTADGNGDGLIRTVAEGAPVEEPMAVWEHLSRSGFLAGSYTYAAGGETPLSAPRTVFGSYPRIAYGDLYAGIASARNNLNTGNPVPATILAEVDRKLDDGVAATGSFRASSVSSGQRVDTDRCVQGSGADAGHWRIGPVPETNCGGTWLLE